MIIFLYGEDTYRSSRKLNEIAERYKKIHKSGLNLKYFDFQKDGFEDFKDYFRFFSMFGEKKLVVLKNSLSKPENEDGFKNNFKNLLNSTDVVIFYEEKIDKRRPLFKLLQKHAKIQQFELLKGKKLESWAKKEFKKHSAKIKQGALSLLLDYVGENTWQLANEINKLVNYKNKKTITEEDVRVLVKSRIETDIFETIDAIASKDQKRAISLVRNHLKKGDSPSYILTMINFQFRNLLIVKDLIDRKKILNQILKEVNLHPFVIKKSFFQAKKFQLKELKKIYQELFQIDIKIKTGKVNPEEALSLLIAQL